MEMELCYTEGERVMWELQDIIGKSRKYCGGGK